MNVSKGFLLVLIAIVLLISALMVVPFLQYFLIAVLLAYVLYPLQRRLAPRFGERVAAVALVALATVAVVIPFVYLVMLLSENAVALASDLEEDDLQFATIESGIEEYTGVQVDIAEAMGFSGENVGQLVGGVTDLFGTITHVLLGIGLAIFLLYYFLKDGRTFVAWLQNITPLPDDVQSELYTRIDDIAWAVLGGHVFVAILQGTIAGVGLVVVGIPNAVFWTFVMIVLALLPIIGTFLVWGPAALFLLFAGRPVAAGLLALYGTIVVGVTDDYVRPIVVDRRADLNPSVILIGVVGGIYAMGFMGLFFGPIVIGVLKASLVVFGEHYERLGTT